MHILLLRHGETDWNKEERLQGHHDILMNNHGIMQIKEIGIYIYKSGLKIDKIVSSPLCRAKMSSEIVASIIGYSSRNIIIEPLFIERNFGIWEGMTKQERDGLLEESGMESVEMLCERAKKGIDKYVGINNKQNILVVAHGAILKAILVVLTEGKIAYGDDSVEIIQGDILCLEYKEEKIVKIYQNLIKNNR